VSEALSALAASIAATPSAKPSPIILRVIISNLSSVARFPANPIASSPKYFREHGIILPPNILP
jgi:hypothetical protein